MNNFNIKNKDGYYKGRIVSIKTKDECVSFKLCVYPKELNKNIGYITIKYLNKMHKDPILLDGKKVNLIHSNNKWKFDNINECWA